MVEINNLDFFGYNGDQKKVLALLNEPKKKIALMVAPAFVVDFDYKIFVSQMKALGFDKVTELTFGAKIVNQNYHKYIREHYTNYVKGKKKKDKKFQEKFISSTCPASVELIQTQFPKLKKFLLPFDSPMGAMSKIVRKNFPNHTIVFLAPCFAKKLEASKIIDKKKKHLIEACVTFSEMRQIISKERPKIIIQKGKFESAGFDSFYNDYTKIYPLAGGLCGTLHYEEFLGKKEVISCDGAKQIQELFKKNSNKVLYDILFCEGGCIGGTGVATHLPIFLRKQKVINYKNFAKIEKMNGKRGLEKYYKGISFEKKF